MEKLPLTQAARERRAQLENALLELMRTKGYAQTSVTDICRIAGIPRRTFYHYFDCKEAVLHAAVTDMLNKCRLDVMLEFDLGYGAMRQSLVRNFRYWLGEPRKQLEVLLDNGLSGEVMQCVLRWLETEHFGLPRNPGATDKELEIITLVGASGFFSLLVYWRKNNYRETPEEMADYAMRILAEPLFPH